jgi:hypothetical protein
MRLIIHHLLSYLITPAHVQRVNIVLLANLPRYIHAPVAHSALGKVIPTLHCVLRVLTKPRKDNQIALVAQSAMHVQIKACMFQGYVQQDLYVKSQGSVLLINLVLKVIFA